MDIQVNNIAAREWACTGTDQGSNPGSDTTECAPAEAFILSDTGCSCGLTLPACKWSSRKDHCHIHEVPGKVRQVGTAVAMERLPDTKGERRRRVLVKLGVAEGGKLGETWKLGSGAGAQPRAGSGSAYIIVGGRQRWGPVMKTRWQMTGQQGGSSGQKDLCRHHLHPYCPRSGELGLLSNKFPQHLGVCWMNE